MFKEKRVEKRKEPGQVQGFDSKQKSRKENFPKDAQVDMLLCAKLCPSLDSHHHI